MRKPLGIESLLAHERPTRGELARLVLILSIPTILAELSITGMEYIDTAMVGSLGAGASAAVGLVASTTWLTSGLCSGASVGFSVQVAQLVGAGRLAAARNVVRQALVVLGMLGLVLALASAAVSGALPGWLGAPHEIREDASLYFLIFSLALPAVMVDRLCTSLLQCAGDMRTPSVLNIAMCVFDVGFNFFLIFPEYHLDLLGMQVVLPGANMGVAGAALGTALSEVFIAVALLVAVCLRSPQLKLVGNAAADIARAGAVSSAAGGQADPVASEQAGDANPEPPAAESWRLEKSCLLTAARICAPVCLERVVMTGAQIVSTAIVAPLGTVAVAAHSLAITAEGLCYMPGFGVGSAATTLVGQSFGAGRRDLARRCANFSTLLGVAIMTLAGAIMFAAVPAVMALFTPSVEVQELACAVLRIELFAEPMFAVSLVVAGALRGAGDTLVPSLLNLGTMWGVRITLALTLVPTMGLYGVWVAMCVELCIRGSLFLVRLLRGRWFDRPSVVAR